MPFDSTALWEDPFLRELQAELSQPFESDQISWRLGATYTKDAGKEQGLALAYMDARDVMERLDGVMGIGNWQDKYINAGNGKTCCEIGLFLDGQWVWKSDGAGDTATEGDKGAFSDAFKRSAVRWGIGRYLYDMGRTYVDIQERGRSWVIKKDQYTKLNKAHDAVAAKVGMSSPSERAAIKALAESIKSTCHTQEQAQAYIESNKGMLQQLRAGQQGYIQTVLEKIGKGV